MDKEEGSSLHDQKYNSVWIATLYYAQGLPFSLVRQTSTVFFKSQGATPASLGLIALYGIPWTFKFLWSPFVDEFWTKRKWTLFCEFLLALVLLTLGTMIGAKTPLQVIAATFFVTAFFSATHDTALDGFYLEALDTKDQAKFSGWRITAYQLAVLTGKGLLVSLSDKFSWTAIFCATGVLFLALLIWHSSFLPRPQESKKRAERIPFIEGFRVFLARPGAVWVIAFAILFKLGDALLFGMSTPFLLDAGMSRTQLGVISGGIGFGATVFGAMFGGWFISKYSLRRGIVLFGLLQNVVIPLYSVVAWFKMGVGALGVAVVTELLCSSLGASAYSNFLMRQNTPGYKATHFAVATSLMSLTTMSAGVASGFLVQHFIKTSHDTLAGYGIFFFIAFLASFPGMLLIPFVIKRPECQ